MSPALDAEVDLESPEERRQGSKGIYMVISWDFMGFSGMLIGVNGIYMMLENLFFIQKN